MIAKTVCEGESERAKPERDQGADNDNLVRWRTGGFGRLDTPVFDQRRDRAST
jgi:hypothetical protein